MIFGLNWLVHFYAFVFPLLNLVVLLPESVTFIISDQKWCLVFLLSVGLRFVKMIACVTDY